MHICQRALRQTARCAQGTDAQFSHIIMISSISSAVLFPALPGASGPMKRARPYASMLTTLLYCHASLACLVSKSREDTTELQEQR